MFSVPRTVGVLYKKGALPRGVQQRKRLLASNNQQSAHVNSSGLLVKKSTSIPFNLSTPAAFTMEAKSTTAGFPSSVGTRDDTATFVSI